MVYDERLTVTDWNLAKNVGKEIVIGKAFAFIGKNAFAGTWLSWMSRMMGESATARPQVVSLLGAEPVALPGASIRPLKLPQLKLSSITSDKALYREKRDEIHLLAIDPLAPNTDAVLEVKANGVEFARHPVRLDSYGVAVATLRDLLAGEYQVRFHGAPENEPACSFTVAEYRLAPLVASLVERRMEKDSSRLFVKINLETYGTPVDGGVQLELTDRGRRIATARAEALNGLVEASFTLEGEGPHSINLQLVSDPSRTATIPIVGSRAAERSRTIFSLLGAEITGSLLPGDGASPVRGIFLEEGAQRTTPFRLESVSTRKARLTACTAAESVLVVVIDPVKSEQRELSWNSVAAGDLIEVDLPSPAALLAIGAYVGGEPWEGWAAALSPERFQPRINVPALCSPGTEVSISIETGQNEEADIYLIVKDARLLTTDTPSSRLAGHLKNLAEEASKKFTVGRATNSLSDAVDNFYGYPGAVKSSMTTTGAFYPQSAPAMPSSPVMESEVTRAGGLTMQSIAPSFSRDTSLRKKARPKDEEGSSGGKADSHSTIVEEPEVVFAGLVRATGGLAKVKVKLGDGFADYIAEAFVINGLDWAPVEARFRAEKDLLAALDIPAFVHPGDTALGRLHAGARSGRLRVRVTKDGQEIPLVHDGRPLAAGRSLELSRAEISFLAGPGEYEATVEDLSNGMTERVVKRVEMPGKLKRISRTLRFLEQGESISRDKDSSIASLRVLPGLEKPFHALVDATADYGHACCEQTAAKMLAACAMYALSNGDLERKSRAESIIIAGVRRESSMWLRGRGLKMYPENPDKPDQYYGPKAARYLRNLDLLRDVNGEKPGPALSQAIEEGLAIAEDTSKAYKLPWPPKKVASCEEAYSALRFNDDRAAREEALSLARKQISSNGKAGGAVAIRTEAAYAAAALLRGGSSADRVGAINLANSVVKDLGENGRLYSTVDSVAAIALMSELRAARIVGGSGVVEVDGKRLSTTDAIALTGEIRSIRAAEGVVAIEVTRNVEEDWSAFAAGTEIRVSLEKNGKTTRQFAIGDAIDLRVKLVDGYKNGDLLWVCLPDALSRVVGGGQVKRFAIDFEGKDEVSISLAATSVTADRLGNPGSQKFAVCVRNMFEEERAGNPGLLEVAVSPNGEGSIIGRALEAFRSLFG